MDPTRPVSRAAAEPYAKDDHILRRMLDKNIPLTREAYLAEAWGLDEPEVWGPEHEAEVPEIFRDADAVGRPGKPFSG